MATPSPLVSIITPSHNCASVITETLRSVQSQTFTDWEHIIIDDASTDNSRVILEAHCDQEPRARWIGLSQNQGAAVARNAGIDVARGRYIAFLDSDDLWYPEKLRAQLEFMNKGNIAFSFCSYDKIDEQGKIIGEVIAPKQQRYRDLLKNNTIGCLTMMYDTKKLGKIPMPLIRLAQDLGLSLSLLKKTKYAYGMQDKLAQYRIRSNSISANKASAAKFTWKLYREVEKLPLPKAIYYFTHYAVNGIIKTYLK